MEADLANTIHIFHKMTEGAQSEHSSWTGSREHIKKNAQVEYRYTLAQSLLIMELKNIYL